MKLVIAGGRGLIGTALVAHAVDAGHQIRILSRTAETTDPLLLHWDGRTQDTWTAELQDADVVVNLCGASIGEGRWTTRRKAEILESRIEPARCLIAAMQGQRHKPVYVQASAVGFYGPGSNPVDEQAGAGTGYLADLATKWEQEAYSYSGPVMLTRFGVILDDKAGALPMMLLPFRLFCGGKLGSGQQWLSWITLRDAAGAILFSIEAGLTGVVNVVSPTPVKNADFASAAGSVLRRPAFLSTPALALRTLLGEQSSLLLEGQKVRPTRLLETGYKFSSSDIHTALHNLFGPAP